MLTNAERRRRRMTDVPNGQFTRVEFRRHSFVTGTLSASEMAFFGTNATTTTTSTTISTKISSDTLAGTGESGNSVSGVQHRRKGVDGLRGLVEAALIQTTDNMNRHPSKNKSPRKELDELFDGDLSDPPSDIDDSEITTWRSSGSSPKRKRLRIEVSPPKSLIPGYTGPSSPKKESEIPDQFVHSHRLIPTLDMSQVKHYKSKSSKSLLSSQNSQSRPPYPQQQQSQASQSIVKPQSSIQVQSVVASPTMTLETAPSSPDTKNHPCPTRFSKIKSNIFVERRKRYQAPPICLCRIPEDGSLGCGEDCINRATYIECGANCPLGDKCTNQAFQRRESIHELETGDLRGYGLRTLVDIPKGALVEEYRGEIISRETCEQRIREQYRHLSCYYFLDYSNGEIVDGTLKGTDVRFVNHSCDPNCHIEKWFVEGEICVGLFASKDIRAGSELTYDYNFHTFGDQKQECLCGSVKCRGWVGKTTESRSNNSASIAGSSSGSSLTSCDTSSNSHHHNTAGNRRASKTKSSNKSSSTSSTQRDPHGQYDKNGTVCYASIYTLGQKRSDIDIKYIQRRRHVLRLTNLFLPRNVIQTHNRVEIDRLRRQQKEKGGIVKWRGSLPFVMPRPKFLNMAQVVEYFDESQVPTESLDSASTSARPSSAKKGSSRGSSGKSKK